VLPLRPALRHYPWGSATTIPDLFGIPANGRPFAEAWLGAHPSAPARIVDAPPGTPSDLCALIGTDPETQLGADVLARFGPGLPYLLKVIAAERPLSLQVHPDSRRALAGFRAEEAAGIPRDADERNYRDPNHKPELVLAVTRFEAMCGFRSPRRVIELLAGLDTPLTARLTDQLRAEPTADGIRRVFRELFDPATRPAPELVDEVARSCSARLARSSPSPRADRTAVQLAEEYPGDPGVVVSLLLNPVTLQPGEAMFVPAGGVHAYLEGTALEIMASSDNVLRAGLTTKHVDVAELLACVDYVAAPPVRIAPEVFGEVTRVYYAPVDDFELSMATLVGGAPEHLPGRGPRVLLCLDGQVEVVAADGRATLSRGQALFVGAHEGRLTVQGTGTLVQADVP